jgi:hypothetical protein
MLVLTVVMLRVFPQAPVRANPSGFVSPVVAFELAGTPEDVAGILGDPGTEARAEAVRKMDRGNQIDFAFMIAYAAFHVGIALLLAAHGLVRGAVLATLLLLAAVMAPADALENRELLFLSHADPSPAMTAALAHLRLFTLIKWYAIFGFAALATPYVWRERDWWRWTAPLFGLAALFGLAWVVYPPALEYGGYLVAIAWLLTYIRSFR